jgi:replication initiation protein RepC
METGTVSTPFGRRPISLAQIRRQRAAAEIKTGKSADKWQVLRDASAAMTLLGIQSNSLAVLDALLSFYPENELRQEAQLIVFPSNMQLSLRAHGMAGSTMRRHLATLVDAGLIIRKDSANGKRYARKDRSGSVETAFGFDLSPLLARAEELAMLAQQVVAERAALRRAKENLTICRRDVRKLITAALEEGADGDWQTVEDIYRALVQRIPRIPTTADIEGLLQEMEMLKEEVLNLLEFNAKEENTSTNHAPIEQHIQNSNTESPIEFEPRSEKEQGARANGDKDRRREPPKSYPLGLVLKACPQICDYGPGGAIASWRDLMSAAVVVRSMLGVSPSAYQEACEIMGPENAAVAVACILERSSVINSAGGYLRSLTQRCALGTFSLGPMIMALLNANGGVHLKLA